MVTGGSYSLVGTDAKDDDNLSDGSMDMMNDPRFTTATVLDKRLHAFTAQVGFVGGLTSGASLSQCFKLKSHLKFGYCNEEPAYKVVQSIIQLTSFFGMSFVLCLSLYSTLVSVNQSYFGNRLMTAGANGFELARAFYMNPDMVSMRHKAVKFLARALILLLVSSGGMLYVKFSEDQDIEAGYQDEEGHAVATSTFIPQSFGSAGFCAMHVHPAGVATILIFSAMSFYLYFYIQIPHERLFKEIYTLRYQNEESFGRLLDEVGGVRNGNDPEVRPASRMLKRDETQIIQRRPIEITRKPNMADKCVCM